jgi:hypothetical protein
MQQGVLTRPGVSVQTGSFPSEWDGRRRELAGHERVWLDFATPERGFFVHVLRSGVTKLLLDRYETVKVEYLEGRAALEEVHEAFSDFAKSTRRTYFVTQLVGEVFEAKAHRTPQIEVQRVFESKHNIKRVRRKSATPQIMPRPDQMDRMRVFFKLDPMEFAMERTER